MKGLKIFVSICIVFIVSISVFAITNNFSEEENLNLPSSTPVLATSFSVPDSMDFCGEVICLTRYDLRERFDRELMSIVYRHSHTMRGLKLANRYYPIIEPILKKNGIPTDFKYLAHIESNFEIRALSGVKAAGIWQFMPETAKEFGLEVNDEVDERYNFIRSTEAACAYFRKAYQYYGDWFRVAASYNAGMGRISRESSKQQVSTFEDLYLNEETSRYVFRILAIKYFLKNPQMFGYKIQKKDFYSQVRFYKVKVDTKVEDWATFAKSYGYTFAQLKEINMWIRSRGLENKKKKTYDIYFPKKEDIEYDPENIILYQENWAVK